MKKLVTSFLTLSIPILLLGCGGSVDTEIENSSTHSQVSQSAGNNQSLGLSVSGVINDNRTWTIDQSPYILTGPLQIATGAKITVSPGVKIIGNGHTIEVLGFFEAIGTSSQPIEMFNISILNRSNPFNAWAINIYSITGDNINLFDNQFNGMVLTLETVEVLPATPPPVIEPTNVVVTNTN